MTIKFSILIHDCFSLKDPDSGKGPGLEAQQHYRLIKALMMIQKIKREWAMQLHCVQC